ncbi:hypothetical protein ACJZ2D_002088 [Fusarium nematophilum]
MVKNDRYTAIPMFSRHFNQDIGENQFFPSTLGTERTIQHVLALRRQKISLPLSLDPFPDGVSHDLNLALASARKSRPQFLLLMSLGEELKSHPSIVHGGFQCVILDQAFHHLIMLHHENIWRRWRGITHVAASMNTHHRAPLSTPGDILVRAWLVWRSHGAWFCRAEIVNSEGVVTTTASAKWVTLKPDAPSIVGMEELEAAEMEELKKTYSEELEAAAHAKELEAAAYAKTEELVAEDVKELEAAIKELKATAHANVKKLKAAIKELKDDIKARKPSSSFRELKESTRAGETSTTGGQSPGILVNRHMLSRYRSHRRSESLRTLDGLSRSVLKDKMKSMYTKRDYHRGVC